MSLPEELKEVADEFMQWCKDNADRIAVRDQVDGKWGSFFLSELPREKQVKHVARWFSENQRPIVMKEPQELDKSQEEGMLP